MGQSVRSQCRPGLKVTCELLMEAGLLWLLPCYLKESRFAFISATNSPISGSLGAFGRCFFGCKRRARSVSRSSIKLNQRRVTRRLRQRRTTEGPLAIFFDLLCSHGGAQRCDCAALCFWPKGVVATLFGSSQGRSRLLFGSFGFGAPPPLRPESVRCFGRLAWNAGLLLASWLPSR